jgi:N6-L-threonylcarbamoyladenine synthase
VDVLVEKIMAAREKMGVRDVVVAGGVACNDRLRSSLNVAGSSLGIQVYYPRPEYCTDNGAMIAAAGYNRLLNDERADMSMDVRSKYPIQDLMPLP